MAKVWGTFGFPTKDVICWGPVIWIIKVSLYSTLQKLLMGTEDGISPSISPISFRNVRTTLNSEIAQIRFISCIEFTGRESSERQMMRLIIGQAFF